MKGLSELNLPSFFFVQVFIILKNYKFFFSYLQKKKKKTSELKYFKINETRTKNYLCISQYKKKKLSPERNRVCEKFTLFTRERFLFLLFLLLLLFLGSLGFLFCF